MQPTQADIEEYGLRDDRARCLRWEFAAVFGFWILYEVVYPVLIKPTGQPAPWGSYVGFLGTFAIIVWIVFMSGDSAERFGFGWLTDRQKRVTTVTLCGLVLLYFAGGWYVAKPSDGRHVANYLMQQGSLVVFTMFLAAFLFGYCFSRVKEMSNSALLASLFVAAMTSVSHLPYGLPTAGIAGPVGYGICLAVNRGMSVRIILILVSGAGIAGLVGVVLGSLK